MRETYLYYEGNWIFIPFDHLKNGDIFRLQDNGEDVIDEENNYIFGAISDPYMNEDGILTIDCEPDVELEALYEEAGE